MKPLSGLFVDSPSDSRNKTSLPTLDKNSSVRVLEFDQQIILVYTGSNIIYKLFDQNLRKGTAYFGILHFMFFQLL